MAVELREECAEAEVPDVKLPGAETVGESAGRPRRSYGGQTHLSPAVEKQSTPMTSAIDPRMAVETSVQSGLRLSIVERTKPIAAGTAKRHRIIASAPSAALT